MRLISRLLKKGARELKNQPYCRVFEINNRRVEIADSLHSHSLEERLERFDIGISGIGVEFTREGRIRSLIRDEAIQSLKTKTINLIRPLISTKHMLTTIERMERYAKELNFTIHSDDIAVLWREILSLEFDSHEWNNLMKMYRDTSKAQAYLISDLQDEKEWLKRKKIYGLL